MNFIKGDSLFVGQIVYKRSAVLSTVARQEGIAVIIFLKVAIYFSAFVKGNIYTICICIAFIFCDTIRRGSSSII